MEKTILTVLPGASEEKPLLSVELNIGNDSSNSFFFG
jgi:hypothetical protein